MGYKTIFAPVMFEETTRTILRSAIALGEAFSGHIIASHMRANREYYPPVDFYPIAVDLPLAVAERKEEAATAFARALRERFQAVCDEAHVAILPEGAISGDPGTSASWSECCGVLPDDLGRAARIADICVTTLPTVSGMRMETTLFESLLMDSARPVLAVPASGLSRLPETMLLAWDGSAPGARAALAALPMMQRARSVIIFTGREAREGAPDAEAFSVTLARHGVRTRVQCEQDIRGQIGEHLLQRARDAGAEMIVMGGYSHSRLEESLLGGVTRAILTQADRPVLMMH